MARLRNFTVTIAQDASLSGAVALRGLAPVRIETPAAMTGAKFTFQTSSDGVTYRNKFDPYNVEHEVAMAAAESIDLYPDEFLGVEYLKIRTGTSGAASAQAAARTLTLVAQEV